MGPWRVQWGLLSCAVSVHVARKSWTGRGLEPSCALNLEPKAPILLGIS